MAKIKSLDPSTHRELNERYSQQHRHQDSQSNCHHHDVPRQVRVITKQQLGVHMSYEQETSTDLGYSHNGQDTVWRRSLSKMCHCRLTIKSEVTKQRRYDVKQEAEANTDIRNVLHPFLSRSEKYKRHISRRVMFT